MLAISRRHCTALIIIHSILLLFVTAMIYISQNDETLRTISYILAAVELCLVIFSMIITALVSKHNKHSR